MSPEPTRTGLLRLDTHTCAGLSWLRRWARVQLTGLKRSRKYRVREVVLDPREAEVQQALVDLERATGQLLEPGEASGDNPQTTEKNGYDNPHRQAETIRSGILD